MAKQTPANDLPGNHPDPPVDLRPEDLITVKQSGPWYRLNSIQHESAIYFDRSGWGRFDGPDQSYGILYLGEDIHTCFIECFGRTHTKAVEEIELKRRNLFEIKSERPLKFAKLSGEGLVRLGADSRITTGNYAQARKWVEAIWTLEQQIEGVCYRSRIDNDRFCYGIFDRATPYLREKNLGNLVDYSPNDLSQILYEYDYGLL
ncbi:MAG: RES family NAD+ phosphorylase [Thermosynechococcaceae cyanobacterium]